MSAAKIIPERIRGNPGNFFFLDINVDADFDRESFIDLVFSFRQNRTLRYITLVRSGPEETIEGKPVAQRSIKELRLLIKAITGLPTIKTLDFEGFADEEVAQFTDLLETNSQQAVQ
jgi:hypothetical protein